MSDHERIWLQAADDAAPDTGRVWCQDKVWPDGPEDTEPTEYVRADLLSQARAEGRREGMEEAAKIASAEHVKYSAKASRAWPGIGTPEVWFGCAVIAGSICSDIRALAQKEGKDG